MTTAIEPVLLTIERCACCGSEAGKVISASTFFRCAVSTCGVEGPANDPDGAKWNALMKREKPIPEGAVRVEIPIWFENGEFLTAETSVMAGRVQPFSDIFATVIAHIVPPVTQVVDGVVV